MENKFKLLNEEDAVGAWRQKLNNLLINYFSYLAWAVAAVIFVVGLFFFIYPKYQTTFKASGMATDNLEASLGVQRNYLAKLTSLKATYGLISEADREKLSKLVPIDDKITDLIPAIESMIVKNGAILNSIKLAPLAAKSQEKIQSQTSEPKDLPVGIFNRPLPEGVKSVQIDINLSSVNYQVLKNIIKTIENNARLLDISKVSYTVTDNKASLVIFSYYF